MAKRKKKGFSKSVGKAPGEVIYLGDKEDRTTHLDVYDYTKDTLKRFHTDSIEEAFKFKGNDHITWINVNGLSQTDHIIKIGNHFNLHHLILEDIVDTGQRPKIDEHNNYLFVVLKMLYFNKEKQFTTEHISIIIGEDYVITFQESEEDVFDQLRSRINNPESRLRSAGSDYLGFALMDAIIDNYFLVTDVITDRVETIEDELFMDNPRESIAKDIQILKHDILRVRRNVFPSREVVGRIVKTESILIKEKTQSYFRDLQDHIILINENIEVYREMIWGLMDMYMTNMSNKMNGIMKVLTIIATIFIPLTFIVGVYGMNFKNMPELGSEYGYYVVWLVMLIVFIGLIIFFKKKKWL